MKDNVIDLGARREAREVNEGGYTGLVCPCGEAWFTGISVCFEQDGRVTGWGGEPKCVSCGRVQYPGAAL